MNGCDGVRFRVFPVDIGSVGLEIEAFQRRLLYGIVHLSHPHSRASWDWSRAVSLR